MWHMQRQIYFCSLNAIVRDLIAGSLALWYAVIFYCVRYAGVVGDGYVVRTVFIRRKMKLLSDPTSEREHFMWSLCREKPSAYLLSSVFPWLALLETSSDRLDLSVIQFDREVCSHSSLKSP